MPTIDPRFLRQTRTTSPDGLLYVPELAPVVTAPGGLMTRGWLDWARRVTQKLSALTVGGGGDVVGPAGATADAIALYSGTTGKLIKDSLTTLAQLVTQAVNAAIAAILPGGTLPVGNLPAHHATHEPGGADALVNAAWKDLRNVFTREQVVTAGAINPTIHAYGNTGSLKIESASGDSYVEWLNAWSTTNQRTWTIQNMNGAVLRLQAVADNGVVQAVPLELYRPGGATVGGNLTATGSGGNVACKDQGNTFTQDQTVSKAYPTLVFTDTMAAANARVFRLVNVAQSLYLEALTDGGGTTGNYLALSRSGDLTVSRDVYEKGRTVPMGHWVVGAAESYCHIGGLTGTYTYALVGKSLFLMVYASGVIAATGNIGFNLPSVAAAVTANLPASGWTGSWHYCDAHFPTVGATTFHVYNTAAAAWPAGQTYLSFSLMIPIQ